MTRKTHPYLPDYATPPGYVFADHLESRGLTLVEFARRHAVPVELIEGVIAGSARIDATLAAIFESEFELEAKVWLNMEEIYRRRLEQKPAADVAD